MGRFSSLQYQKRRPSMTSPYSFEQPVSQFASFLSPTHQSPPPAVDAQPAVDTQLEQAHLFGPTLDQISVSSPARPTPAVSAQHVSQALQEQKIAPPENHTGLPDALKTGIECLSGFSLDDVRVHYNSYKPAEVEALAYTQGSEIYMGPGQEQYLAHEAWHVVQQMQRRVRPTLGMKENMPINDDVGLETEADIMGAKAVAGHPSEGHQDHFFGVSDITQAESSNSSNIGNGVVQRIKGRNEKQVAKVRAQVRGTAATIGIKEAIVNEVLAEDKADPDRYVDGSALLAEMQARQNVQPAPAVASVWSGGASNQVRAAPSGASSQVLASTSRASSQVQSEAQAQASWERSSYPVIKDAGRNTDTGQGNKKNTSGEYRLTVEEVEAIMKEWEEQHGGTSIEPESRPLDDRNRGRIMIHLNYRRNSYHVYLDGTQRGGSLRGAFLARWPRSGDIVYH